ncbi:MAG TPA: FmdB family zinc ribbon protein [Planctomycetota bacterium]
MPTYDYVCKACGHELELFQNISEAPKKKCPACKKSRLERKIGGGAGFLFKGSGFYLTDYRSESYRKAADAESKPADKGGEGPAKTPEAKAPAAEAPSTKKKGEAAPSAPAKKNKAT